MAALKSIEALKEFFDLNTELANGGKFVRWNLYNNHRATIGNQQFLYKQDNDSISHAESWETLQRMITLNGDGKYTIYIPNKGANRGALAHISIGNVESFGVGSAGGSMGVFSSLIDARVAAVRLEMENQRLQDELNSPHDDSIKGLLFNALSELIPYVPHIIGALASKYGLPNQINNSNQPEIGDRIDDYDENSSPEEDAVQLVNDLKVAGNSDIDIKNMIKMIKQKANV